MKLAKLNEAGVLKFHAWLVALKDNPKLLPPKELLVDKTYIDAFAHDLSISSRAFSNRFEFCHYLHSLIGDINLSALDSGFWTWTSLFFIDELLPPKSNGDRMPRAFARYIPEQENFRRYYRHLLAGPYYIYHAHRDDPSRVMALLCQPISTPGDVYEQLVSRQEIVSNPSIMSLATQLYVDPTTNSIKRGAGGKSSGSARRLIAVLEQFDLTWDLYSAPTEELLKVLPKEFSKYR